MPPERRQLVIDLDAADVVRERVGPVAWLVLEAFASRAPAGQPVIEVPHSSRALAATVSLSKDSVARALRRLTDVGIVERVDHRHEQSGRFGPTTYRVDLATVGLRVNSVSDSIRDTSTVVAPRVNDKDRRIGNQLSLLD